MIIISKEGIQHQGTKQELMLDLVNLLYTFADFVSKGMISLIIDQTNIAKIKVDKVVTGAFEVILLDKK